MFIMLWQTIKDGVVDDSELVVGWSQNVHMS